MGANDGFGGGGAGTKKKGFLLVEQPTEKEASAENGPCCGN